MDKMWANCLVRGLVDWNSVPSIRVAGVKAELQSRVEAGTITAEQYEAITGEVSGTNV